MTTFFKWLGIGIFTVLIPILLICSMSIPSWRSAIGGWLVHEQISTLTENNEQTQNLLDQKLQQYDSLSSQKTALEQSLETANADILNKQGNITELTIQVAVLTQQKRDLDNQISTLFTEIRYLTTQLQHADTSFVDELTMRLENRGLRYFDQRINANNSENLLINVNYGNASIHIDNSLLNASLFDNLFLSAYDIIDNTYVTIPFDTARFYTPQSFNYIFRASSPDQKWLELREQIALGNGEGRILFVAESNQYYSINVNVIFGDKTTHNVEVNRTQECDFEFVTHNGINVEPWFYNIAHDLSYSFNGEPFGMFNPIDYLNMNLNYFTDRLNITDSIQELNISYLMNNEIYSFTFKYKINNFS